MKMRKWNVFLEHEKKEKIDELYAPTWEKAWERARATWKQYDSDELVVEKFVKASVVEFKRYEQEDTFYRGLDAIIKHPTEELDKALRGSEWQYSIIWDTYDEDDDTVIASIAYEHGYMMERRRELLSEIKQYNK